MKFDVLTLFPEMFEPLKHSIIERASKQDLININLVNIRDFSKDKHKKVDDTPYGGGAGMVMMPSVVYDAYNSIQNKENAKVIEKLDKYLKKFDVKKFMKRNPNMTSPDFHMIMYNETYGLLN